MGIWVTLRRRWTGEPVIGSVGGICPQEERSVLGGAGLRGAGRGLHIRRDLGLLLPGSSGVPGQRRSSSSQEMCVFQALDQCAQHPGGLRGSALRGLPATSPTPGTGDQGGHRLLQAVSSRGDVDLVGTGRPLTVDSAGHAGPQQGLSWAGPGVQ